MYLCWLWLFLYTDDHKNTVQTEAALFGPNLAPELQIHILNSSNIMLGIFAQVFQL